MREKTRQQLSKCWMLFGVAGKLGASTILLMWSNNYHILWLRRESCTLICIQHTNLINQGFNILSTGIACTSNITCSNKGIDIIQRLWKRPKLQLASRSSMVVSYNEATCRLPKTNSRQLLQGCAKWEIGKCALKERERQELTGVMCERVRKKTSTNLFFKETKYALSKSQLAICSSHKKEREIKECK